MPLSSSERTRAWQLRNAAWLDDYKAEHGCAECGERDPVVLQLDHIDPNTKLAHQWNPYRRTHGVNWTMLGEARRAAELLKCQVLCANCHLRKTKRDIERFWEVRRAG